MNWKKRVIFTVLITALVASIAKNMNSAEEARDTNEDARGGLLDRWPWLSLLPLVIVVAATVGLLMAMAFMHPIDTEYTLAVRWSYIGHGVAGTIALLAAIFGTNRIMLRLAFLIAIEFYLFGMFMQFLIII